jgi:hypothetical protein
MLYIFEVYELYTHIFQFKKKTLYSKCFKKIEQIILTQHKNIWHSRAPPYSNPN